jgi:aldehyde dehydrogenase (NAD+)
MLALAPLVGAIAAGNCIAVKPSERAPHTSTLLADLIPRALDAEAIRVVPGDADVARALARQAWDHILFTGSASTGRAVLDAAAPHLTPVTLELGGKSPAIVTGSADLDVAARRIAWGKYLNAGQSCLAPDYALVVAPHRDEFLARLHDAVTRFYGPDPRASADYGRLIDAEHVDRLVALLDGGTVAFGGTADRAARYVAPTALRDVDLDAPIMTEEIFGPVLPVVAVDTTADAIAFVRAREHPLALYVFSRDRREARQVVDATQSGSVAVNTTVIQAGVPGLPFGGVGASGTGAYHGRAGFDRFSHHRAVFRRTTRPDLALAYPPYDARTRRWWRRLL